MERYANGFTIMANLDGVLGSGGIEVTNEELNLTIINTEPISRTEEELEFVLAAGDIVPVVKEHGTPVSINEIVRETPRLIRANS